MKLKLSFNSLSTPVKIGVVVGGLGIVSLIGYIIYKAVKK